MKIELKNVQHAAFASQETDCFTATVYINGVKSGTVSNEGFGGCNSYHPNTLEKTLSGYAKTLPKIVAGFNDKEGNPIEYEQDADTLIGDLFSAWLVEKDFKRAIAKRILFTRDGAVMQTKSFDKVVLQAYLKDPALVTKLKADKVLNLLPVDEALKLYAGSAA
jgi:hypothetical protein